MPVKRYATEYNMSHTNRGIAVILNHEYFDNQERRYGTNFDCENLQKSLTKLQFEVRIFNDLCLKDIRKVMNKLKDENHTDSDCILIAILSHGDIGYISAKDTLYKLDNIWNYFTPDSCPSLAGKPKLFFIQSCQGLNIDNGIPVRDRTMTDSDSSMSYTIPLYADFLIAYSTVLGFVSYRSPEKGTWFISTLCDELDKNGETYDILKILTMVSKRVALDFISYCPDTITRHGKKQIPCITSMLIRSLFFSKKNDITNN